MQYFISFLEGFITFTSPCLLPMLPIYFSYFAQTKKELAQELSEKGFEKSKFKILMLV